MLFVIQHGQKQSDLDAVYVSSSIGVMKARKKTCFGCREQKEVLYRCKYQEMMWSFLCESCLIEVKTQNPDSYQYGGTWKAVKK
ncbi:MAG TPA: hypothetical protein DER02_15180 [Gammaproteobacteria bacterium]|nr:hypothetical protein [Gammaproteobacteria bacterium]|tara:strand:+ start:5171 stop:5422 length:252 start_codon:yes stop_codon:yes gene_type:complete